MNAASDEALLQFLRHMAQERRLSNHSVAAYRRDLLALGRWCDTQGIADWALLDHGHVRAFSARIHAAGLGPRSIQRRLSAVRSFFVYLQREGLAINSPAVDVRAPKTPRRLPRTVDADLMARLLDHRAPVAKEDAALHSRDMAIMELLYSSGLRLSELVGLDITSLDLTDRTVRVVGKGNKTRIVPVGRKAITALEQWYAQRAKLAKRDELAVFVGNTGRRLGARAIQLRLKQIAQSQGLPVKLHPHLFRHSFATHMLESSHDLRGVQELLGHADISTTQVYTHLDFQHLANVYDGAHPRARRRRTPNKNPE